MKVKNEPGVLPASERYFATPSANASQMLFYVTRCGHYYYGPEYDFRSDSELAQSMVGHYNYFMMYVCSGRLYFEGDEQGFAEAGQMLLVDCRRPHRFFVRDSAESLWIHFDGANTADLFRRIIETHGGRQVLAPPPELQAESVMMQIISSIETAIDAEVFCSMKLYQLMCGLMMPKTISGNEGTSIAEVKAFLAGHLAEPVSVREAAARSGFSPSHFSRLFRRYTGFSPHEYLSLLRISKAKELLYSTSKPVREIAELTGFNSEVNFIAAFKKKTGIAPGAFRKQML